MDFATYYNYKEIVDANKSRHDFICPCCKKSCWIGDSATLKVPTSTNVVGFERHGNSQTTTYKTTYHEFRICKNCDAKIISNNNSGAKLSFALAILFIVTYVVCYWFVPATFGIFPEIHDRGWGTFIGWLIGSLAFAFFVILPITFFIYGKFAPSNKMTLEEAIKANAVI